MFPGLLTLCLPARQPAGGGRSARGGAALALMLLLLLLVALSGCGGSGGDGATAASTAASGTTTTTTTTVHATLTSLATEPAGTHCTNGGTSISAGLDTNDNGKLDASEVNGTQYVCNGSAGAAGATALVKIAAEPAGTHCAQGGSAVSVGLDANGNGTLEASEATSTSYVCNGSAGTAGARTHNSLVAATAEAAGPNCTYGGTRITAGLDANDSGVLDPAEVTSTSYSCNGAPGATGATGAAGSGGSGGAALTWVSVSGLSASMASNTGYLPNNAAQVVLTLPATPAVGDVINIVGQGTGGWKLIDLRVDDRLVDLFGEKAPAAPSDAASAAPAP